MRSQMMRTRAALVLTLLSVFLTTLLGGCGRALPADAKEIVFDGFDPDENATIYSAKQVEPLQVDLDAGAEEVWCVNLTYTCWSCDYGEFRTCADSRLLRRINGEWQVSLVFTDEDKELWEARGCELIEGTVGG